MSESSPTLVISSQLLEIGSKLRHASLLILLLGILAVTWAVWYRISFFFFLGIRLIIERHVNVLFNENHGL
jgi:hypothetical protein